VVPVNNTCGWRGVSVTTSSSGIAEDIIANLTRFRSLMVIARHSGR
jgi:TolB-like protein